MSFFFAQNNQKVVIIVWDWNTTRLVSCVVCGKGFKDDCGDVFCSSKCEREWEVNNQEDEEDEC